MENKGFDAHILFAKKRDEIMNSVELKTLFSAMIANRKSFDEEVKTINSDSNLNDYGKKQSIARAFSKVETEHKRLKNEYENFVKSELVTREASLYRHPAGSIYSTREQIAELRTQTEKASQALKENKLDDFVSRASKMKDEVSLRASAIVSYEAGNFGTLQKIAEHDSSAEEVSEWERTFGKSSSIETRFLLSFPLSAPKKPSGLPELEEEKKSS